MLEMMNLSSQEINHLKTNYMTRGVFKKIEYGIEQQTRKNESPFYIDFIHEYKNDMIFFSWRVKHTNNLTTGIASISFKHITKKLTPKDFFTYEAPDIFKEVFRSEKINELKYFLPSVESLFEKFKEDNKNL